MSMYGDIGLEDFDSTDVVAPPRLNIVHMDGQFEISTTKETFSEVDVIFLGMVKQRIMWHPEIPSGESPPPMCKSTDFQHGFPEMDEEVAADYRFPWEASNFSKDNLLTLEPGVKPALKCGECKFKEWGTDPKGDRPWCSEDWVMPLLYKSSDGSWQPAIASFKRSAMKPAKQYVGAFATSRTPLWSVVTRLTLDVNKRGSVRYSVPKFQRVEQTDQGDWGEYLDQFRSVRDYLKAYPRIRTDEDEAAADGGAEGWEASESPWENNTQAEPTPEPAAPKAEPKKAAPKARPKPPPKPEPTPEPEIVDAQVVEDDDDDDEPPF